MVVLVGIESNRIVRFAKVRVSLPFDSEQKSARDATRRDVMREKRREKKARQERTAQTTYKEKQKEGVKV